MRKRQIYSSEFKLSILQELETKSLAEVCRKHNLACSTVCGWSDTYKNNPKEAFKGNGNGYKEEAKIAEYERVIGRLYAQNELLKKAYQAMKEEVLEQKKRRLNLK